MRLGRSRANDPVGIDGELADLVDQILALSMRAGLLEAARQSAATIEEEEYAEHLVFLTIVEKLRRLERALELIDGEPRVSTRFMRSLRYEIEHMREALRSF